MSVNNISFFSLYNCTCGSSLSEATKRKLIALGIGPATVNSESEAKALIESILKLRKNAELPNPFETEKNKISKISDSQTKENSENMMSMLNYESNVKRIILGL